MDRCHYHNSGKRQRYRLHITSTMLDLNVRTNYWGRSIAGGVDGNKSRKLPPEIQPLRRLLAQVGFNKSRPGGIDGCCPHMGERVFQLTESYFLDYHRDRWDLYYTTTNYCQQNYHCNGHQYHEFVLVPQNLKDIDYYALRCWDDWAFLGECSASVMRMDLECFLQPFLADYSTNHHHCYDEQNVQRKHQEIHFHIKIYMDSVFDRGYPTRPSVNRMNNKRRQKKTFQAFAQCTKGPHPLTNITNLSSPNGIVSSKSVSARRLPV